MGDLLDQKYTLLGHEGNPNTPAIPSHQHPAQVWLPRVMCIGFSISYAYRGGHAWRWRLFYACPRRVSEQEVLEVNHIIKSRAERYIAGRSEDNLFPEKHLKTTAWNKLANCLMPLGYNCAPHVAFQTTLTPPARVLPFEPQQPESQQNTNQAFRRDCARLWSLQGLPPIAFSTIGETSIAFRGEIDG